MIAFDYGATLRMSDGSPALRELVKRFNELGVPAAADMVQAGRDKAKQMEQLGATLIFDDSRDVCLGVRLEGRLAVQHVPEVLR